MTATPTCPLTLNEMAESLTGFEEVAIATNFGADVGDLLETKPTMGYRALIAVHKARDGGTAKDAKKAAMALTIKQAYSYFVPEEDGGEVDPERPVTESGKDDSELD